MDTAQTIVLYSGLGFFSSLTLVGMFLHVIPMESGIPLFSGLVGTFIGVHVPSPIQKTIDTPPVQSVNMLTPPSGKQG